MTELMVPFNAMCYFGVFLFPVERITMVNGKSYLFYDGYTFFYRYKIRMGDKWVCTNYPRCKAYITCLDNPKNTIVQYYLTHNHDKKRLILGSDGKYFKERIITI